MVKYFGGHKAEGEEEGADGLLNKKSKPVVAKETPAKAGKPGKTEILDELPAGAQLEPPASGVARVGVSCGLTIAIAKYESARPSVSIELPCSPDAVDQTFDAAYAWVGERLAQMRADIEGAVETDGG